jgi:hypothetical protein
MNLRNHTMLGPEDEHTWPFAVPTYLGLLHRATAWLHGLSCRLVSTYYREAEEGHRAVAELLREHGS